MEDGYGSHERVDDTADGPSSSFDFNHVCKLLDPKDTPTKLWHRIIDKVARVILFYQVEYEFTKPKISRCIRLTVALTRDGTNSLCTVVKPTVFLNDRELPVSFVESKIHRHYLKSADELTGLINAVEVEPVEAYTDELDSQPDSRLEPDPAAEKLQAILRRTKNQSIRAIAARAAGKVDGQNSPVQRRKNSRRVKELSCAQPASVDEPQAALPQISDEHSEESQIATPKVILATPTTERRIRPKPSAGTRKSGDVERVRLSRLTDSGIKSVFQTAMSSVRLKAASPPETYTRSLRPSTLKKTQKKGTNEDSDVESDTDSPPSYSRKGSPELYGPAYKKKKVAKYSWSTPSQGRVPLHSGHDVYIHHNTLQTLSKRCDLTKTKEWPKYAFLLLEHLSGGWADYFKRKSIGPETKFGIVQAFGDDLCEALVGHVEKVFQALIPKSVFVDTMNSAIAEYRANP
ncbi:hypothetical protein RvY_06955 [Ramazzottius varieornatus]|uniref:Uncharacterized protein n=1 Tax=Ramazzottius varieornatus TaxID=947166 RepID=A0A1D1V0D4_RAMVA|nr:hypothetical protein RvY_06955 [Ramazzottius varieornatus]